MYYEHGFSITASCRTLLAEVADTPVYLALLLSEAAHLPDSFVSNFELGEEVVLIDSIAGASSTWLWPTRARCAVGMPDIAPNPAAGRDRRQRIEMTTRLRRSSTRATTKHSLHPSATTIPVHRQEMAPAHKPEVVSPSSSEEPSEPSEIKPENKPKDQLTGTQQENPQVVMHKPGKQATDAKSAAAQDGKGQGDKVEEEGFSGGGYTGTYGRKSKL
ncbi:hypothetical protein BC835DRAFT_1309143 [Cytidiella melzeri]|nr:hypothetical protein BC835DRAFT_1309143 [Cytidiella melzeri]